MLGAGNETNYNFNSAAQLRRNETPETEMSEVKYRQEKIKTKDLKYQLK